MIERKKPEAYKLIIFDLDGTLAQPASGETFRQPNEDYVPMPGRKEKIAALEAQGIRFGIATNQGGIAYGILDIHEAYDAINQIALELGIGLIEICPHHPQGKISQYQGACHCRKPEPGMLQRIMDFTEIDPVDTLMVGDRQEDSSAAFRAGVDFLWSHEFFS